MEAGIIHSPSAALVMDVMPVIRVVYAPVDERVGVKSQRFFDRNGDPVQPPRQMPKADEPCRTAPRQAQP